MTPIRSVEQRGKHGKRLRGSEGFVGIEEDGDGAVIRQLDGHVCAKYAGRNADAERFEGAHEFFVEGFGKVRRSGFQEAGTPLAVDVAVECELRHGEDGAAGIEKRAIHYSQVVIEDTNVHDFLGGGGRDRGRIVASDCNKDDQAGGDFTGDSAVHQDSRATHTLDHSSHGLRFYIGSSLVVRAETGALG
jgi:hypothetical protein